jgi:hypothetical protein
MSGAIVTIVLAVAYWRVYQKMGREGWEGIIPFYNSYVLFEELYGNGWKFLLLLIPFYNIYVVFKCSIDLADSFHKSAGFGVGLALLAPIFWCILAFSDAYYLDGSQEVQGDDVISQTINSFQNAAASPKKDENALEKLKELNELLDQGVITEEEFNAKKEELLKRI